MNTQIIYADKKYFLSFYETLSIVAKERIYIEMIEAPPFADVCAFQSGLVEKNGPIYYAVQDDRVVGWCDVFPNENIRQSHRGSLGMGLLPEFRGQRLGYQLLSKVVEHAKLFGLEKIELNVYTSNVNAIALYRKSGFVEEGLIKHYRKLDGQYFDCLTMAKFL